MGKIKTHCISILFIILMLLFLLGKLYMVRITLTIADKFISK